MTTTDKQKYWTLFTPFGYATRPIPGAPVFTDPALAKERAREENRFGPYKGRGVKAVRCDQYGNLI